MEGIIEPFVFLLIVKWLKLFSEFTLSPEEARALLVVREMGAITNADYPNINSVDTLSASASLRRLRDCGLLESKGKSSQTYYVSGKVIALKEAESSNISPLSTELTPQDSSLSTELTPNITALSSELNTLSSEFDSLPSDLQFALSSLGSRSSPDNIKNLILKLCVFKSFKLPELAALLKRVDILCFFIILKKACIFTSTDTIIKITPMLRSSQDVAEFIRVICDF